MSKYKRSYKDSVFVDLLAEDEKVMKNVLPCTFFIFEFQALPKTSMGLKHRHPWRVLNQPFENRQSRFKKLGKKVPQAYRVQIEDTFLPCDAEDARIFSKIPALEFYVFYNGTDDYPETAILKLSDAFITKPEQILLELEVKVFNINKSKGTEVLSRCKPLEEYSLFVEEVRKQMQLDSENGFTNAVKICIEKGILKDYLMRKSREVINMLIAEYDYDTDIAVQRQESLMIGIEQGIERGIEQGSYQKALETTVVFKKLGFDIIKIAEGTGLSIEEIEKL